MIFLNPEEFKGCETNARFIISGIAITYFIDEKDIKLIFGDIANDQGSWKFDSLRNLIKARDKIDRICKNKHNQVDDLLYTIETQ